MFAPIGRGGKALNVVALAEGHARRRVARVIFQGTLTADRGTNECGLIVAATSAIVTSAMILRSADLQIEYRGNSTPPERNMIAQRGVGISRGRLFKCRRLSCALCMPRFNEKRATPYFYRLFASRCGRGGGYSYLSMPLSLPRSRSLLRSGAGTLTSAVYSRSISKRASSPAPARAIAYPARGGKVF
jgi:hypothetical protein